MLFSPTAVFRPLAMGTLFFLAIAFMPSSTSAANAGADLFREMLENFPECQIDGVYIAQWEGINQPQHKFFKENNLSPYKIGDDFAYYRLDVDYYGLPVVEMMIPAGTWAVYTITFALPLEKVQQRLQSLFGSDFRPSQASQSGRQPELIADPENDQQSIWLCTSAL